MGSSGCLKSIEHVWEPFTIKVDLPDSAALPHMSKLCKAREMVHWPCTATVGLQAPPAKATMDSQQLAKRYLQVVQYIEHGKEHDICKQLLEGQT